MTWAFASQLVTRTSQEAPSSELQLQTGTHAGSSCPSLPLPTRLRDSSRPMFCQPLCTWGPRSPMGMRGWEAEQHSAEVSERSLGSHTRRHCWSPWHSVPGIEPGGSWTELPRRQLARTGWHGWWVGKTGITVKGPGSGGHKETRSRETKGKGRWSWAPQRVPQAGGSPQQGGAQLHHPGTSGRSRLTSWGPFPYRR